MEMKMRHLIAVALLLTAPLALAATTNGAMSLIPRDAVSVGVVHVSDMRTSPLSSMLFQQTDKVSANGDAERFLTDAGLKPSRNIALTLIGETESLRERVNAGRDRPDQDAAGGAHRTCRRCLGRSEKTMAVRG